MGQTAVSDNQSSSLSNTVTEMLNALNWQTLQHRRIQNSLIIIMLYKIKYYRVAVEYYHLTEIRKFDLNFFVPYSRTQYHMNSYFPRTIRYWNSLKASLKASPSLYVFTTELATVTFQKPSQFMLLAVVIVVLLNVILIYVHTCLNITNFSSFSASCFPTAHPSHSQQFIVSS